MGPVDPPGSRHGVMGVPLCPVDEKERRGGVPTWSPRNSSKKPPKTRVLRLTKEGRRFDSSVWSSPIASFVTGKGRQTWRDLPVSLCYHSLTLVQCTCMVVLRPDTKYGTRGRERGPRRQLRTRTFTTVGSRWLPGKVRLVSTLVLVRLLPSRLLGKTPKFPGGYDCYRTAPSRP